MPGWVEASFAVFGAWCAFWLIVVGFMAWRRRG